MHASFLIMIGLSVLTAASACAQFAAGAGGGRGWGGGGGIYGVTRRTYMGVPNVIAARYFQNSGLPLVNPANLNAIDSTGGAFLAANRPAGAARQPGQSPRSAPALVKQEGVPADPVSPVRALPRPSLLARTAP